MLVTTRLNSGVNDRVDDFAYHPWRMMVYEGKARAPHDPQNKEVIANFSLDLLQSHVLGLSRNTSLGRFLHR